MKNLSQFILSAVGLLFVGCAAGDPQVSVPTSTPNNTPSIVNEFNLPSQSQQVVLGITESWNNSYVSLQVFDRVGNEWVAQQAACQGRLGRKGSSWGLGLHPPQTGKQKVEGDGRTPAGVFSIGGVWGYDANCQRHPATPYRQITTRDLWVEDTSSPYYNQHLTLDHEPKTKWQKDAQMRQNDDAHSLKLFIAHNAAPNAQAGKGSAIFFHIWRGGGSKSTAGCTTMPETKLRELIATIDPTKRPTYVILPRAEYNRLKPLWLLP